ncbi:MAG: BtpA/SgcQ family protein [Acidimicrobiia bacterium]|nr:BtpA/SgcQ family protein [Acidimicrobiia bacterium]
MDDAGVIKEVFGVDRALIGVVHLEPLPGTPRSTATVEAVIAQAVAEARLYAEAGYHGLIIENMGDRPYLGREVGPEVVATMTATGRAVVAAVDLAVGVQVLAGANQEALAVAQAIGGAFARVEGFVFAHVADEGVLQSDAAELLRYRRAIGADNIRVFADIKKKHSSHAMTADVDLADTASAAEFFLADGVVVTGTATGSPTTRADVEAVAARVSIPTLVGSGVNPDNLADYARADALIVGSYVKVDGLWSNEIDPRRVDALARAFAALPNHDR